MAATKASSCPANGVTSAVGNWLLRFCRVWPRYARPGIPMWMSMRRDPDGFVAGAFGADAAAFPAAGRAAAGDGAGEAAGSGTAEERDEAEGRGAGEGAGTEAASAAAKAEVPASNARVIFAVKKRLDRRGISPSGGDGHRPAVATAARSLRSRNYSIGLRADPGRRGGRAGRP